MAAEEDKGIEKQREVQMIPDYVHGCIAPVFTAFHEDGRLDDEGQRTILDYIVETEAVSAFFVRCGLGKMYTFSYEDVEQIARTACEHLADRAPVLVGTTGIWDRNRDRLPDPEVFVQQAVELSQYAEGLGAAAVVHTLPEAIAPKPKETCAHVVMRYFETICAAVNIPVFIYQPPGTDERYGVTVDLVRKLADIPNLKGMKLSTSNAEYILDITWAVAGKDFGFIVGAETAFLAGLVSGGRAVIGQGATLNPQILKAIQDRYEAGDITGAIEAQRSTNLLVQECPGSQEFLKRHLAEKGRKVKPFSRTGTSAPYGADSKPMAQAEYERFKRLFESELAKYV